MLLRWRKLIKPPKTMYRSTRHFRIGSAWGRRRKVEVKKASPVLRELSWTGPESVEESLHSFVICSDSLVFSLSFAAHLLVIFERNRFYFM